MESWSCRRAVDLPCGDGHAQRRSDLPVASPRGVRASSDPAAAALFITPAILSLTAMFVRLAVRRHQRQNGRRSAAQQHHLGARAGIGSTTARLRRHQLLQTYSSGEMSVEVTRLAPDEARRRQAGSSRYRANGRSRPRADAVQRAYAAPAFANTITCRPSSATTPTVGVDDRFANIYLLDPEGVLWQRSGRTSFRWLERGRQTGPGKRKTDATSASNWNPARIFIPRDQQRRLRAV